MHHFPSKINAFLADCSISNFSMYIDAELVDKVSLKSGGGIKFLDNIMIKKISFLEKW